MNKNMVTAVVLTLGMATSAWAASRGDGIINSPHDLYSQSPYKGNESQARICSYCHTPHHAATSGADYLPLWSKDLSQDTMTFYTVYNSSTINAAELRNVDKDKAIGPTRLCMSCHDGTVAPDQHYGSTGGTGTKLTGDTFISGAGVGAEGGLSNDHPVGFDYAAVAVGPTTLAPDAAAITAAKPTEDPWIRNPAAVYLQNNLNFTIDDRLYPASDGKKYMTCATCHDVHNRKNVYTVADAGQVINYLVLAPQAGSALCLTCHIK